MRTFALALLLSASALPTLAQGTIAPPTTGLLLSYHFWPEQYVQWLGSETPYSMLELDVNSEGKTPVYDVTLTSRADNKRVQYTNDDATYAAIKAEGEEVHKTAIAFDPADSASIGSACSLRLTLADGKPLQWHFVQGSEISEQGSGLTPLPYLPFPVLAYREQGAVAGEGTALQIGATVSPAEVWKEISQPPYFIAYHGAYTINAHRLAFAAGRASWKIVAAPATLAIGAAWQLLAADGSHRSLTVTKVEGAHYTVTGVDSVAPADRFVLEATRSGDAWTLERVRFLAGKNGEKHPLTVQFAPAGAGSSSVDVVVGRKTVLSSASLATMASADGSKSLLEMKSPAWAKGKTMAEQTTLSGTQLSVEARPRQ